METQIQPQNQTAAIEKIDPRQANLKDLFNRSKGAIAQVLPKHLTADRILKVTLAATSRTPKLLECSQTSILQSVMQAAQLGLEPGGPLGHAYLVPFKKECTLIVGYRGLIELARRSNQLDSIEARVVYARDKFRISFGLHQVLEHEPSYEEDPGEIVGVYSIARLKDGAPQVEFMTRAQVDKIRRRSPTSNFSDSPWRSDYDEMARKTVVRRICKYLPLTAELATALELNENETEVDPRAFSAIPIEISDDKPSNPLAEKLAETARKTAKPGAPQSEAPKVDSGPTRTEESVDIEPWKIALDDATDIPGCDEINKQAQAKLPPQALQEFTRLYMARCDAVRGKK